MSEREITVNKLRIKAKTLIIEPDSIVIKRPKEVEIETEEVEEELE